jgi:hypothetical protein
MKQTSVLYNHDELLREVSKSLKQGLKRYEVKDTKRGELPNLSCLLSGLAVFTFKHASLLQFDHAVRENKSFLGNLKRLFAIEDVPSDTYLRERLDVIDPKALRLPFNRLFQLLQRSKILQQFQFLGGYYLISLDGTGVFSSSTVHCENCCQKHHRDGTITYCHQVLGGALVHPDQKVVFPFVPEPIMQKDGSKKNDCERNASKRWAEDFRTEHPHLKAIIVADGLSSNGPFIQTLREKNLSYILVAKETDHHYLTKWVQALGDKDKMTYRTDKDHIIREYEFSENIPLNDTHHEMRVNVVRFKETVKGKTTSWMWVTDLILKKHQLEEFVKGARARWKIENETFNTLKNQGYAFEHNFGHGNKNLNTIFSMLMMLAFFIDQCLQKVNKTFQAALLKVGTKRDLWATMLFMIWTFVVPNFSTLYQCIADPPEIPLPVSLA